MNKGVQDATLSILSSREVDFSNLYKAVYAEAGYAEATTTP